MAWLESIEHSIAASEDAAKIRKTEKEAVALARKAKQVIAAKGKSIARLKTSADSSDEDLTSVLMGPTGNLRAQPFLWDPPFWSDSTKKLTKRFSASNPFRPVRRNPDQTLN